MPRTLTTTEKPSRKTVFSNSGEVYHVWSSQTRPHGRNGTSNASFIGTDCKSYWATIGRIVADPPDGKGPVAILSTRKYSATTRGHEYEAESAVSHLRQVFVPWFIESNDNADYPRSQFSELIDAARKEFKQAKNKIQRAKCFVALRSIVTQANAYCSVFKLKRFTVPKSAECEQTLVEMEASSVRRSEAATRAAATRRERDRAKWATIHAEQAKQMAIANTERQRQDQLSPDELRAEWQAGGTIHVYAWRSNLPYDLMRFSRDGSEIETTRSARVPTDHVRRIAGLVLRVIDSGQEFRPNGHTIHIGHYSIDHIESSGVVHVGCHTFHPDEVRRIAGLLSAESN